MMDRFDRSDNSADVFASLRELFSHGPYTADYGPEALARLLFDQRFLPYEPLTSEVETALEALVFEERVLP